MAPFCGAAVYGLRDNGRLIIALSVYIRNSAREYSFDVNVYVRHFEAGRAYRNYIAQIGDQTYAFERVAVLGLNGQGDGFALYRLIFAGGNGAVIAFRDRDVVKVFPNS